MNNQREDRKGSIKISVIIPVYNKIEYLKTCIQSVQNQTIKEIEFLCVDDGSTDNSLCLLMEMKKNDARIQIFEQTNQGAGAARNRALIQAKGEYIFFLDADDFLLDHTALEKLYYCAVNQKVEICGGEFYINRNHQIFPVDIYRNLRYKFENEIKINYNDYQYDYYHQNYIYSRRFLLENEMKFPQYKSFEDPPFFVKAMYTAKTFCVVDVPFYCYRNGDKKVYYDEEKMIDVIKGITDNLIFSKNKGLKKLHRLTYFRLLEFCDGEFQVFIEEKNINLLKGLECANREIQWEWLEERCNVNERVLKPLSSMRMGTKKVGLEMNKQKKWILPVQCIQPGNRIALYGAGEIGRSYFRQLQEMTAFVICGWVDRNFVNISDLDYKVESPEILKEIDFDYILIAVAKIEDVLEILECLACKGIPSHKIIWSIERGQNG